LAETQFRGTLAEALSSRYDSEICAASEARTCNKAGTPASTKSRRQKLAIPLPPLTSFAHLTVSLLPTKTTLSTDAVPPGVGSGDEEADILFQKEVVNRVLLARAVIYDRLTTVNARIVLF